MGWLHQAKVWGTGLAAAASIGCATTQLPPEETTEDQPKEVITHSMRNISPDWEALLLEQVRSGHFTQSEDRLDSAPPPKEEKYDGQIHTPNQLIPKPVTLDTATDFSDLFLLRSLDYADRVSQDRLLGFLNSVNILYSREEGKIPADLVADSFERLPFQALRKSGKVALREGSKEHLDLAGEWVSDFFHRLLSPREDYFEASPFEQGDRGGVVGSRKTPKYFTFGIDALRDRNHSIKLGYRNLSAIAYSGNPLDPSLTVDALAHIYLMPESDRISVHLGMRGSQVRDQRFGRLDEISGFFGSTYNFPGNRNFLQLGSNISEGGRYLGTIFLIRNF